jgi:hypothetical protein
MLWANKLINKEMEHNFRELSQHLSKASSLLSTILDSGQLPGGISSNSNYEAGAVPTVVSNSTPSTSRSDEPAVRSALRPGIGLSTAIGGRIGTAVVRA